VREAESKPPSATAAQHRADNARRKTENLEARIKIYKVQRDGIAAAMSEADSTLADAKVELERHIKMLYRVQLEQVPDPVAVGLSGLDSTATERQEGKGAWLSCSACAARPRRGWPRRRAVRRALRSLAGRALLPGAMAMVMGTLLGALPKSPQTPMWSPPKPKTSFKRAMEEHGAQAAVTEYLAEHEAKRQR
ncbi:unnamed protein product, partial [Prorocentrum cordatum]